MESDAIKARCTRFRRMQRSVSTVPNRRSSRRAARRPGQPARRGYSAWPRRSRATPGTPPLVRASHPVLLQRRRVGRRGGVKAHSAEHLPCPGVSATLIGSADGRRRPQVANGSFAWLKQKISRLPHQSASKKNSTLRRSLVAVGAKRQLATALVAVRAKTCVGLASSTSTSRTVPLSLTR